MPIDLSMDAEKGLITRIVRGSATADEYVLSIESALTHPDYRPGMKSLTDVREASHHLAGEDIRRIAQVFLKDREAHRNVKAAIVVSARDTYGLTRMLQEHLEVKEVPMALSVFYDIDEAKQWLGVT